MLLLKACDRVQLIFVKAADDTVYLGAVLLGRRVAVAYTGVCASLFFFIPSVLYMCINVLL